MWTRIVVAVIGIPVLLAALAAPGGKAFVVIAAVIGLVGVLELSSALEAEGEPVCEVWPLCGVGVLVLSYVHPLGDLFRLPALVALFLLALVCETFSGEPQPFQRLSTLLLLTAYPGLIAVAVALRLRDETVSLAGRLPVEAGAAWVGTALLLVWAMDSGAYFIGRIWGRRKLAPHLSPSKTWEGAAGGWVCAAAVGFVIARWIAPALFAYGAPSGLVLGALAGVWGPIGDLAESAMKRELGVKDLGGWLPGHGGVLDRFDSFLFVCPLVYLWAVLGL